MKKEDAVMIIDSLNVIADNLKVTVDYVKKALEEEKKEEAESELDNIMHSLWMHIATNMGNYKEKIESSKQQIRELAKRKIDGCNMVCDCKIFAKRSLGEM